MAGVISWLVQAPVSAGAAYLAKVAILALSSVGAYS